MAKKLKSTIDWEKHDEIRTEFAIREISASENLRFFLRSFLAASGIDTTPVGMDTDHTQRLLGRHELGMELVDTVLTYQPDLYPALIKEQQDERRTRQELDHTRGDADI